MAWSVPRTWTNGEIVTQTMLNTDVRDNMRELWHEIAYVEFTADVNNGATSTEAAAVDVVSSGAITYVANPIKIEFGCTNLLIGALGGLNLWDGATDLGRMFYSPGAAGTISGYAERRLTPTAASHTYKIKIWSTSNNANFATAGAGGTATNMPGYIRVLQKGGT